jgi:hypothetical protein
VLMFLCQLLPPGRDVRPGWKGATAALVQRVAAVVSLVRAL